MRGVSFTGSADVGRIIGDLAARQLKPAVLELGGKNAVIVLDDADVDYAVDAACFSVFMNAGQICMSGDRILVHESLAEEFTAKFTAKVAGLLAGDPADPHTVVGPLVGAAAARRAAALGGRRQGCRGPGRRRRAGRRGARGDRPHERAEDRRPVPPGGLRAGLRASTSAPTATARWP